ncbi:hypothetical protein PAXRUDRAFT_31282 [Paxillus rubicundulus Ve08.2h10]|uniref:Unplaced genomic scaffold scaffold_77, whole genome shotgun sequence n=1 Tax=Paxillus rubicundulus Ve08.2h10 TaxID=930991 RepID=A0A0D0EBV5_9AGAM|nr:hypothetical protein PAXRUDRAFT_31282 [Paxillus rubicundulus Ve08.2h10]
MAYHKISDDVKQAAIHLLEHNLLDLRNILDCCGFSKWMWCQVLRLWRETGDVMNHPTGIPGWICHLVNEDIDCLVQLIHDNPDYFLDEIVKLMKINCFILVHFLTTFNELEQAGMG